MTASFQTLDQMINGFRVTPLLAAVAKLGIPDILRDGPKTAASLALSCNVNCRALDRVMTMLTTNGVFSTDEKGRFGLTPLSECLRSDAPDSLRATAIMWAEPGNWRAYGELMHTIRTGDTAFDAVFKCGVFDYYSSQPEEAAAFDACMTERTERHTPRIIEALDFSGVRTVLDIGGGQGSLISGILSANLGLSGILFDQQSVLAKAAKVLAAAGVERRCRLEQGNFFCDSLPTDADLYIMKWILHDWDDDRAIQILRGCRHSMPQHARLALVEQVLRPDNPEAYRTDIAMMLITGGQERTEEQYRALLAAADFNLRCCRPTGTAFFIIEAVPAP